MKHLERAHGLTHAAARAIGEQAEPSPHLAPAARWLELALAAMYDAFDGRADRPTAINVANARLWDAAILVAQAGLPGALAALREASAQLVSAEERFPRVPLATPSLGLVRAANDLPPLHAIARASLRPSFRAPPEPAPEEDVPAPALPEPRSFEELAAVAQAARRAAAERAKAIRERAKQRAKKPKILPAAPAPLPPGFAIPPPAAQAREAFIRRWTRECFEEIGMIGVQRAPLPGDDWRTSLPLERRMVAAIDAIAAFGETAIAYLEPLAMDAPAANPMSVFAITMAAGCLDGRDALACAERVLHRFGPNDPLVAEPFAAAMKLAQSPFAPSALRSLSRDPEIGCRALAIEVLAYRGWLSSEELAALADEEDPRLLALALPALAAARHPDLGRALGRALAHADLDVQAAALDAMAIAAHPRAAASARAAAAGPLGDRALASLAIVADEGDARWLLERMRSAPSAAAIEAVGWAGLVDAVPALLALLESEDDDTKLAAGAALDRLLGANLVDVIEVLPEELADDGLVDPDPDPPRPRPTLAELVSEPRDQPPEGSKDTLEVPSIDPDKWRAYWAANGQRFTSAKQRLRRGNPHSPSVSLYELDRLPLSMADRRRLHRELCARTGKVTHFDPHDFVLVQEQCLAAWGSLVAATAETPGSWERPTGR